MNHPVRVLHMISSLRKRSGRMSVIMNYYRAIDRSAIQFDFLCFDQAEFTYENEILALGGKVFYITAPKKKIHMIERKIRLFFDEHPLYQMIHYHIMSPGFHSFHYMKKIGVTHRIIHVHSTRYATTRLKSIRNHLVCLLLKRLATDGIACSRAAARFFYGTSYRGREVTIINNAIAPEAYRYAPDIRAFRRESENLGDKLTIGTVGRFSPEKNHLFLIDIFVSLKRRRSDCALVIVGDYGQTYRQIREKARRLGVEGDMIFYHDRDDVGEILSMMDVFVLPSLYEGVPLTVIEAQANQLPCIVSDSISRDVGAPDLVKFIPLRSGPEMWADCILAHNRQSVNPSDQSWLLENYDIQRQAAKLQRFYFNLARARACL